MQMNKKMFKRPIISNFAILPMHKQGRSGGGVPLGPPRHAPPRPPLEYMPRAEAWALTLIYIPLLSIDIQCHNLSIL